MRLLPSIAQGGSIAAACQSHCIGHCCCHSSAQPVPLASTDATPQNAMLTDSHEEDDQVERECNRSGKNAQHVRWGTITVHEFGVGLGGSTVPVRGGPPIGLSDQPEFTWTTNVGDMAQAREGVRRFNREERIEMLRRVGVSDSIIIRHARETNILLKSRRSSLMERLTDSESDSDDGNHEHKSESERRRPRICKRPAVDSGLPFVRRPRMIPANYV